MVELPILLAALAAGLLIAGLVRARRRRGCRDESLRVGGAEELDRKDAALRRWGRTPGCGRAAASDLTPR